MTDTHNDPRKYRLSPRDKTGWILGLSGVQCLLLGAGVLLSGLLLDAALPLPVVTIPTVVAFVSAFARWNGMRLHEQLPAHLRWFALQIAHLDSWAAQPSTVDAVPPCMDQFDILEVPAPSWLRRIDNEGVGIVHDRYGATVASTIPVRVRQFALCETDEQDRLLAQWGDAIAAFANERNIVRRVIWTERCSPGAFEQPPESNSNDSAAITSYRQLVSDRRSASMTHETSVTLVVDIKALKGSHSLDLAIGSLLDELRLFTIRLDDAGFDVDAPMSASEIHHCTNARFQPSPGEYTMGRSLAQLAGLEGHRPAPTSTQLDWRWFRTGTSRHRSFAVEEWPRLDLQSEWMEPMVFDGSSTRTLTIVAEPVAPSRSRRQVERDATKLLTDESQRVRAGFRVGIDHQRANESVLEREQQLASGFVEFSYTGIVTVTSDDADSLRDQSSDYLQVTAQSGVGLIPLDGRHDLGLMCSLPLGLGPQNRRIS